VTCASASSVWRRPARSCVSCSLRLATRRRACCTASAACAAACAWAAARCASELASTTAARSAASRVERPLDACVSCWRSSALRRPVLPLRVAGAPLGAGALCVGGVARPPPRLALARRRAQPRACPGERGGQLRGALPELAQREVEVLALAPHQRERDPEPLL